MRRLAGSHPLLTGAIVLVFLGAVPSALSAFDPVAGHGPPAPKRDARYATQSGDLKLTRERHIDSAGDEIVDGALETCAGLGPAFFAERYGIRADPELVARHFARRFDRAVQDRVFEGCLEGFLEGG